MTEFRLNTGISKTVLLAGIQSDSWNDHDQTAEGVLATSAPVRLRDGSFEIIDVASIDTASLIGLPVLNAHHRDSIDDVLGVVTGARVEGDRLIVTLHIDRAEVAQRVKSGVLRSLSIGYTRVSIISETIDPKTKTKTRVVRVKAVECSLVPIPADPGATVRAEERKDPCSSPKAPNNRRKTTTPSTTRSSNLLPSNSASRRALRFEKSSGRLAALPPKPTN